MSSGAAESEVRALLDNQAEAMRMKDVDRLMSVYSYDVIYFDVVPPLQYAGSAALRGRFLHWFDSYKGGLSIEIRDLNISANCQPRARRNRRAYATIDATR